MTVSERRQAIMETLGLRKKRNLRESRIRVWREYPNDLLRHRRAYAVLPYTSPTQQRRRRVCRKRF